MPKLKTKSSAKKRFKVTGSGKLKRKHAFKSHILTKKETKRKRNLTQYALVDKADELIGTAMSEVLKNLEKDITQYPLTDITRIWLFRDYLNV